MLTAGWESTKGVSVRPGNRPRSMARLTAVPARPAVACSSGLQRALSRSLRRCPHPHDAHDSDTFAARWSAAINLGLRRPLRRPAPEALPASKQAAAQAPRDAFCPPADAPSRAPPAPRSKRSWGTDDPRPTRRHTRALRQGRGARGGPRGQGGVRRGGALGSRPAHYPRGSRGDLRPSLPRVGIAAPPPAPGPRSSCKFPCISLFVVIIYIYFLLVRFKTFRWFACTNVPHGHRHVWIVLENRDLLKNSFYHVPTDMLPRQH